MLDAYQKIIHKKFPASSWLSDKKHLERVIDWTTFYRRNIPVFIEHYLKISLYWYQIIWLYILNSYITTVIIAGRASAKSYVIALFACAKCILYPNTMVVVVSGSKKQAGLIVKEKIQKELIPNSDTLRKEIKKINTGSNDIGVVFRNGSSLVVVVGDEGALGYRGTVLIYEEFKRIKKYVVDKVIKPFAMTRPAAFRKNEECEKYGVSYSGSEFDEETANIYISSAAPTSHWMGQLLKDTIKSKYSDERSCMLATDYSIALRHRIKTKNDLIEAKRTTDPITWREEYENEMLREGTNTYFSYNLLTKRQTNKKAFYPKRLEDVRSRRKNSYSIPKQNGEVRIVSCDMAFIERANKNDNSCFTCIRALPESVTYESKTIDGRFIDVKNGYRRIPVYMEANPGSDIDKQAIRIKQLYYDFDADYLVLDTRNGGLAVYDRLAKILYDEDRDCEYPAWKCMNDSDIANRVNVVGANENVFAINASQKTNNDIAIALRTVFETQMIDLLVNFDTAKDVLESHIPEYTSSPDPEVMSFYERPFLETQALINEMISLEYTRNEQTGIITLFETGSNTKDRYISLAYGNYFIGLLEQDLLSDDSDYDFEVLVN